MLRALAVVLALSAALAGVAPLTLAQPVAVPPINPNRRAPSYLIDDFNDFKSWKVVVPEGVKARASFAKGAGPAGAPGIALKLDYEFVTGGGYAIVRKPFDLTIDPNQDYEFTFAVSAPPGTPENNFEFKLIDETGENVWWVNKQAYAFPTAWKTVSYKPRHVKFAWGPGGPGKPLTKVSAIEFAVAASGMSDASAGPGGGGNKGTLLIDNLTFRTLPRASGAMRPPSIDAARNRYVLDFGDRTEVGGLVVRWKRDSTPSPYDVDGSDDGRLWITLREVDARERREDTIPLIDVEVRYLRIRLKDPEAKAADFESVDVLAGGYVQDENGFIARLASTYSRGVFPRWAYGEQTYFAVVGAPGDTHEALVSEEGAVEIGKRGFTLEPFLYDGPAGAGILHTWADATSTTQTLLRDALPIPTVVRDHKGLRLSVTAFADGPAPGDEAGQAGQAGQTGQGELAVRYVVENTRTEPAEGALFVAVRPFQVNPPWQNLKTTGGVSPIRTAILEPGGAMLINGRQRVLPLVAPEAAGSTTFHFDDLYQRMTRRAVPTYFGQADPNGLLSAAVRYSFKLAPGEKAAWSFAAPLGAGGALAARTPRASVGTAAEVDAAVVLRMDAAASAWTTLTGRAKLILPQEQRELGDTFTATLGAILVNRDGPAIQPGSRTYERSWARDGSMTSAALLELGFVDEPRAWVEWFASNQFPSGMAPCVVDRAGPDPVEEHDSTGQMLYAIRNLYLYTGDRAFLEAQWPRVERAVGYIQSLRAKRLTDAFGPGGPPRQEPGKPPVPATAFRGLVPESISHEGYSAKPMHSYWDCFFVYRGLTDAAEVARALGKGPEAEEWGKLADEFRDSVVASINAAVAAHGIDYIPGCVELGDFDATSTTVALVPCGAQGWLPPALLRRTFDKYWEEFAKRRDAGNWKEYTPYEWRVVGAMVRLGERERALAMAEWFMQHRRPAGWRHWAEVVSKDDREARFIGDMPHTWVGSDFLQAVRTMFMYEDEGSQRLVLFAGVPEAWARGEAGTGFDGFVLPRVGDTPARGLQAVAKVGPDKVWRVRLGDPSAPAQAAANSPWPIPPGGLALKLPVSKVSSVTINGQPGKVEADGTVVVRTLPALVEMR